jgi:hypothetical protein
MLTRKHNITILATVFTLALFVLGYGAQQAPATPILNPGDILVDVLPANNGGNTTPGTFYIFDTGWFSTDNALGDLGIATVVGNTYYQGGGSLFPRHLSHDDRRRPESR